VFSTWGKPGKAGKQVTGHEVPGSVSGPQSGSNEIVAGPFRYGRNPIAWSYAMRLFYGTSLMSPMVRGRFRPQDVSNPPRRAPDGESWGTPDLGRQQGFRGSFQGPQTVRLGAQSGPSQQPAFPSTNNDSSVDFSGMGLPDVWRVNRL
jgi:hypothetical protein